MLDADTKQRIDKARNILVGVLPMPQAQIDQITYALIYKFMDDMDQQSVSIGGKASFFTDEFAKYAWTRIFDPRLGGYELHTLYTDALAAIPRNPNIPQFIRTVFKNALLPYRNPETLKLFLKTINEFQYSQNDHLGDAFEYLLQTLGSQGDAGQFLTPRHIINFMVEVVDPQKHETILDPACGTAGFLISSYLHILNRNQKNVPGDLLTAAERASLPANFTGYDISSEMVRLALTNLYLHGFSNPRILEYDSLTSEVHWDEYFNVILANPPFMSPTGGIRPHKRFSVQANRSEVLFVDYIAEHLTPNGRAAIIVPEGIIFQSGNAYKKLRKMLVEQNYLWAVVSLPAGVFNPYAGVKTSILFLDKELARKTNQILFAKIENDGFSLGANRTAIEKNDIPNILRVIEEYQQSLLNKTNFVCEKFYQDNGNSKFLLVDIQRIAKGDEYNLSYDRYSAYIETTSKSFDIVKLSEVVELIRGITFNKQDCLQEENENSLRVATTKAAQEIGIIEKDLYYIPKNLLKNTDKLLRDGDILMSTANSINLLGRATYVSNLKYPASFGAFMTLIRPNTNLIDPIYLLHCLRSSNAKKYFLSNAKTTTNISNLTFNDINSFKIPLPLLEVQREIVAEIEGYQRIIDGARQVVDNWKPNLEHELELARKQAGVDAWEKVKLGDVCQVQSGGTPKSNIKEYYEPKEIPWLKSEVCKNEVVTLPKTFISALGLSNSSAKWIKEFSTLVALVGATIGKTAYVTFPTTTNQNIAGLFPNDSKSLNTLFLFYSVQSLYGKFTSLGDGNFKMANLSFVKSLSIHLPPLDYQIQIVEKIETERIVVQSNQKLISLYEEKIKQVIARVWESE
jgi:type I restriction enzyme M protein